MRKTTHYIKRRSRIILITWGYFTRACLLGVAARATLRPQSLATVLYYFPVSIAPPLPCMNNHLYIYTRKGAGRWKHENNNKNSDKRLWLQHTGTIS